MKKLTRRCLLILLLTVCLLSLPSHRLAAQGSAAREEGPEAFVPSERLPAGTAVSFPIDI